MKTKTLILTFFSVVFMCFLSCTRGDELKNTNKFEQYDVIVIDSCEYIQWGSSYGYLNITHKGNCKFCFERDLKIKLSQDIIQKERKTNNLDNSKMTYIGGGFYLYKNRE